MPLLRAPRLSLSLSLLPLLVAAAGCTKGTSGGSGGAAGYSGAGVTGTISSTAAPLPAGLDTACEDPWTVRLLHYAPTPVVPRRMYFASCTPPSGAPRMFVSATLTSSTVVSASEDGKAGNSGLVMEAEAHDGSGLVPTGVVHQLPECLEMHGIAAKSDCSTVAVLSPIRRRATG